LKLSLFSFTKLKFYFQKPKVTKKVIKTVIPKTFSSPKVFWGVDSGSGHPPLFLGKTQQFPHNKARLS
jgi:hypothetical protein